MGKLFRSNVNRYVAGVCGGLGEYFDFDPVIIRIVWFVLALCGAGILAYALFWIFVPVNPDPGK
ncbi:MAG: PspC domain-containing protein [Muribaculaceae bacterium]|nr:PspC domain-containing protein [Muribaculaceae bacterium]